MGKQTYTESLVRPLHSPWYDREEERGLPSSLGSRSGGEEGRGRGSQDHWKFKRGMMAESGVLRDF